MPKPPGRSFQLRPRGRSSSRLVLLVLATVVLFALVGVRNRLSAGRDVYVDSELRWDNQSHEEGDTPIIGAQVGSMNKTITNDQQKVQRATATTSSVRLNLPGRDYTTAMSVKEVQKIDPRSYIRTASNDAIRQQQAKLKAYLESDEYKTKREKQREYPRRGIIINTGGPELLLSAVVLLRVLRHDLNCTLPVTLAWDGDHEMSAETLKKLKADFAPLDGFNLQKLPYPEHHKRADIKGFVGKAYALLHAPYQQVLLLDTDNMPLKDPTLLFDDPDFIASGNMFWPDFWANWINKEIFDIIGLDGPKAMAVLDQGKGSVRRDAESGQILLDLTRHHDVVEMAFLLNSFHDVVYEKIWGDKDTFQLSFALRGKAHEYRQMEVPPGVIFGWRDGELFVKATEDRKAGYQLMGCLQFNRLAEPIFMHRTINKFKKEAWRVWPIDIVTGPVPYRWAHYYIALDSLGPTKGVDYHYVAPREAFEIWSFNPDTRRMKAVELSKRHGHRKWELVGRGLWQWKLVGKQIYVVQCCQAQGHQSIQIQFVYGAMATIWHNSQRPSIEVHVVGDEESPGVQLTLYVHYQLKFGIKGYSGQCCLGGWHGTRNASAVVNTIVPIKETGIDEVRVHGGEGTHPCTCQRVSFLGSHGGELKDILVSGAPQGMSH